MISRDTYGFAQIEPRPQAPWRKWRVWYFKPGAKETKVYTDHLTRKAADARVKWYLNASHSVHEKDDE